MVMMKKLSDYSGVLRAKANRAKKLDEKGRKKRPMPKSGRALKGALPRDTQREGRT